MPDDATTAAYSPRADNAPWRQGWRIRVLAANAKGPSIAGFVDPGQVWHASDPCMQRRLGRRNRCSKTTRSGRSLLVSSIRSGLARVGPLHAEAARRPQSLLADDAKQPFIARFVDPCQA
jgi:hypothetical protein